MIVNSHLQSACAILHAARAFTIYRNQCSRSPEYAGDLITGYLLIAGATERVVITGDVDTVIFFDTRADRRFGLLSGPTCPVI